MNAARAAERFAYRAPATAERSRVVTTRRSAGTPSEAAMRRTAQRVDETREDMQAGFDRIAQSIEALRVEVRHGRQDGAALASRLDTLEFQVNLTRDEVQRNRNALAPGRVAAARTAINEAAKSWPAKVAAIFLAFTTIVVGLNNIPDALRWIDNALLILRGAAPAEAKVDAKH